MNHEIESPPTLAETITAVSMHPDDAHAWVALGRQLMQAGKTEEARECFERALFLDPSLEQVYDELIAIDAREPLPAWFKRLERQVSGSPTALTPTHLAGAGILLLVTLLLGTILVMAARGSRQTMGESLLDPDAPIAAPLDTTLGQGIGRVRDEAAPLGHPILTDEGLRFTVRNVNRDAWSVVRASDPTHEPPRAGTRLFLVRLQVENVRGDEPESLLFIGSDFEVLAESGASYDESCGLVPERLGRLGTSLKRGQATEGNICLLVPQEESIAYLLYEPLFGGDRRYFELESSE